MARPTKTTPSKRKPSTTKPAGATTTSTSTSASVPAPNAPTVGPGSRPSLAQAPRPLSYHLISGALVLSTMAASSLALFCIRQLLRPTFGATAALQYAQVVLIVLCAPSTLVPLMDPHTVLSILGSTIALTPVLVYQSSRLLARLDIIQEWGPGVGATLAQLLAVIPLTVCTVNLMKRWMPDTDYQLNGSIRAGFTTYAGMHSLGPIYAAILPHSELVNPCNLLSATAVVLAFMSIVVPDEDPHSIAAAAQEAGAAAEKKEKKETNTVVKMLLLGLPILFLSFPRLAISNPLGEGNIRMSNCAPIHSLPGEDVHVLARGESVTGTLVVGESKELGFRWLRCDASLLGGQWLDGADQEKLGHAGGESIFAAFDLQQAVLLAEREKKADDRALVIGLGIGSLPSALYSHGVTPTILEVDPLIPPYARSYFSFPALPTQIAEARSWISQRTQARANGTLSPQDTDFAYIVHDVFTGGGVPAHMFTVEVFQELKPLLKPDGVLAVNVVGELGGNAGRAVWVTLNHAFADGKCRAFYDLPAPPKKGEMANMVVFCTPAPSLQFSPLPKTFTQSRTTQLVLGNLPEREISPEQMIGHVAESLITDDWIVREARNYMDKWTTGDVLRHWRAMRKVLPAEVWDLY
ncbi:hypothetical protein DACRYDRAFT_119717 [Dacryopinax primogenitus]|uniref:S-adenosyl-L-methionine-dependent methyltransferase n=1 Tax=Dacryopinax primogenitus (strain DJM 731) TaxID=1858805 RepID=M5FN63_DACPD|nr:uncharacterized protein DACRYDRAFT_119717 [Dacryopinax primogenitus]EJT96895.1 hypothetical protein DACRYDRAFT_119717 [Dacryopinax primogenitus]